MPETDYPQSMAQLFQCIRESRTSLEERVAELEDVGFEAEMQNGWTLRDHLIHLAAWEASLAGILRQERRGPAMGLEPSDFDGDWQVDDVNARLLERHRDMSEEDVRAWFASAHAESLATLETLVDSDLTRPFNEFQPFPGAPDDAPIVKWIAGDTYEHFAEHIALLTAAKLPSK